MWTLIVKYFQKNRSALNATQVSILMHKIMFVIEYLITAMLLMGMDDANYVKRAMLF